MPYSEAQKKKLKDDLGAHIRETREKKGMEIQDLADACDKEYNSIQRLETGGANPSYIYLLEIAKGLDMSLSELLKGLPK